MKLNSQLIYLVFTLWFYSELAVVFFKCSLYKRPFCHPIPIRIDRKCTNLVFFHRNVPIFGGSKCQGWRWGSHVTQRSTRCFLTKICGFWTIPTVWSSKFPSNIHLESTEIRYFYILACQWCHGAALEPFALSKLLSIRCKVWQCVFLWFSKIS